MGSSFKLALASCLILGITTLTAQTESSPFNGTWKITLPQTPVEVSLWIIKIDKNGNSIKLVTGIGPFGKAELKRIASTKDRLTFQVSTEKQSFHITAMTPSKDGRIRGSARIGNSIMPAWLDRTDLDTLNEKNAVQQMPAIKEFQDALKQSDPVDREKDLMSLVKEQEGKATAFFALQRLLVDRLSKPTEDLTALKPQIELYRKICASHGPEMLLGGNLDLTRGLLSTTKGQPLALQAAREAVKLVEPNHPLEMKMTVQLALLSALSANGELKEVPALAKELDKLAATYIQNATGDEGTLGATLQMSTTFLGLPADPIADLGLKYARKAVELVSEKTPANRKAIAYKQLYRALINRGKKDESQKIEPVLAKLDIELDDVFRKENVPFKVEPFAGRINKSDRVVLVELFTNAQTPPTVAADIAFYASAGAYKPKDVVFLQYHVQVEKAYDALATSGSDARLAFYQADLNNAVPGLVVDGLVVSSIGGARTRGKMAYDELRKAIDKAVEIPPDAKLELSATRKGDRIEVKAKLADLKAPIDALRLRIALVESEVRYEGRNAQRLHLNVVRAFIGGVQGYRLAKPESVQTGSVSLTLLKKSHEFYLDDLVKKTKVQFLERPLELKKLKLIAWIQDEESKKVHQAVQIDVP